MRYEMRYAAGEPLTIALINDPLACLRDSQIASKLGVPIVAHRGVTSTEARENAVASLELSVQFGIPAEIDLFFTDAGEVLVHHGPPFRFMLSAENRRIRRAPDRFARLGPALECVRGRVPLVIEFKHPSHSKPEAVRKAVDLLRPYQGEFLVTSFDPSILDLRSLLPGKAFGLILYGRMPVKPPEFDAFLLSKRRTMTQWTGRDAHRLAAWTFPDLRSALAAPLPKEVVRIVNLRSTELPMPPAA